MKISVGKHKFARRKSDFEYEELGDQEDEDFIPHGDGSSHGPSSHVKSKKHIRVDVPSRGASVQTKLSISKERTSQIQSSEPLKLLLKYIPSPDQGDPRKDHHKAQSIRPSSAPSVALPQHKSPQAQILHSHPVAEIKHHQTSVPYAPSILEPTAQLSVITDDIPLSSLKSTNITLPPRIKSPNESASFQLPYSVSCFFLLVKAEPSSWSLWFGIHATNQIPKAAIATVAKRSTSQT